MMTAITISCAYKLRASPTYSMNMAFSAQFEMSLLSLFLVYLILKLLARTDALYDQMCGKFTKA